MHICYIDESGTSDMPGNTSHFVLAGISVLVRNWKQYDAGIREIKRRHQLSNTEIHVAWMLRKYLEQSQIPNFESLSYEQRRREVDKKRREEQYRLQRSGNKKYRQVRKNYRKTLGYIHLSYQERCNFIREIATYVSSWDDARLFAECIDKVHFDPQRAGRSIDEQAFEQIVSRFEQYLEVIRRGRRRPRNYGLLIHDNNETVAKKHTALMKRFHRSGTLWTNIENIIETPLYVDSELTGMVQIADLCGYALRRYLENGEEELFDLLFERADRRGNVVVGVRHFTNLNCTCKICVAHRQ